jgi:starch synthase
MGTTSSGGNKPFNKMSASISSSSTPSVPHKSVALPAKKVDRKGKSTSIEPATAQPSPAPVIPEPVKSKPLEIKTKTRKTPAEPKTSPPAPSSAPTIKQDARPVSPEALARIEKASASAAKAGKGMFAAAAAKAAKAVSAPAAQLKVETSIPAPAPAPVVATKPAPTVAPTPVPAPVAKSEQPAVTTPLAPATRSPKTTRKPLVIRGRKQEPTAPPPMAAATPPGKRVVFISSECTPLAQTGGLGDVVAGLSKALRKRGHDARIIMPLYASIDRHKYGITYSRSCCVHFGLGEEIWVGVYEAKLDDDVPIWFIDYGRYFDRPYIYDEKEDCYRFGVLSKAALQVCKDVDWIPHVAHVHDWMTSMSAVFLKTWDRVLSPLSNTASVLTIHNIGYQGKFDASVLSFYGLGGDYMAPDRFEDFGGVNLLKAGIQYADAVTTVSPTYANEIRGPIGGMGLGTYLTNRSDNVFGIVNGVDVDSWNPATDKFLPARYSRENMAGKAECKRALQEHFGLTVDPKIPVFGIISRFAPQKGFDLIRGAVPQALRDMAMQVVVLGTGDPFTENFFRWLHGAFPRSANAHIGFKPDISHLIEAGSDFFIMPSIYEPCGLNQMYSSLYGTLPIVRATGGLDDTVENYNESAGTGTGFKFWEISGRALFFTIGWANSTWWDRPHHYKAMQQQGMARNFTWDASAQQYENVYVHAMEHRARI